MIYVYHHIGKDENDTNTISFTEFKKHIYYLIGHGYQFVSFDDYNPNKCFHSVITFDDGYKDIMPAVNFLKKHKIPFEVFIVGNKINTKGFINFSDIKKILKSGGHLQWHTNSHVDLTSIKDIESELKIPENILNLDKNGFKCIAYPYWKYNDNVLKTAKKYFSIARSGNGFAQQNNKYTMDAIKVTKDTIMKQYNDKIVKFIDVTAPTWPCNFRCHYCYVGQHLSDTERTRVEKCKYDPDAFAKAITKKRLGGTCVFNFCAFGETLILPQNVEYCKRILENGHFLGIVTNMTITKHIDELLALPKEYLERLFFKCSFHYLELKKTGLLETFVNNVNRAWHKGASITIEITPSDELEPYIDEVKKFSMDNFGALPHITIARNELMPGYVRLTKHSEKEYNQIWSTFDSELFRFKTYIWEKHVNDFCYAGKWVYGMNLGNGKLYICSHRKSVGDLARGKRLKSRPVCNKCPAAHCFNGHAWLAWGAVPTINNTTYAKVRDRIRTDGTHWLHPRVYNAFSQKLWENNKQYPAVIRFIKNLFTKK